MTPDASESEVRACGYVHAHMPSTIYTHVRISWVCMHMPLVIKLFTTSFTGFQPKSIYPCVAVPSTINVPWKTDKETPLRM